MNNCSQAPQTEWTRAAAERYLASWNDSGMDWDAWVAEVRLAKEEFARLINASADEIAVFSSVSEATSAVASTLDFSGTRRNVVVTEAEFPTIGHVWLAQERRGAAVSWVPVRDGAVPLDEYDAPRRRPHCDRLGVARLLSQRVDARRRRACDARACPGRTALRRWISNARNDPGGRPSGGRRLSRRRQFEIPHGRARASRSYMSDAS